MWYPAETITDAALLAGAVEYADCTSAEDKETPPHEASCGDRTEAWWLSSHWSGDSGQWLATHYFGPYLVWRVVG